MAIADALTLAPIVFGLGFLLEPPFAQYVLSALRAFGKDF
jgi:hypothetical protein